MAHRVLKFEPDPKGRRASQGPKVQHVRRRSAHETGYSDHQAVQARRGAGGLSAIGVQGITVTEVKALGGRRAIPSCIEARSTWSIFCPRSRSRWRWTDRVARPASSRRWRKRRNTGKIGDGKIFVFDLEQVVRIRTGEPVRTPSKGEHIMTAIPCGVLAMLALSMPARADEAPAGGDDGAGRRRRRQRQRPGGAAAAPAAAAPAARHTAAHWRGQDQQRATRRGCLPPRRWC